MGLQIQPVNVWYKGEEKVATILQSKIIDDDMATSATFYYQLLSEDGQSLNGGNVGMDGQDYIDWDNSNDQAYQYIAGKLNLTII